MKMSICGKNRTTFVRNNYILSQKSNEHILRIKTVDHNQLFTQNACQVGVSSNAPELSWTIQSSGGTFILKIFTAS